MFEYYKGYEIDGSDTSYNLLTPNFEKIKEMITYFLSLKIIDKNTVITINNTSKEHKILIGKEYSRDNLDELFEDLIKYDVQYFSIRYHYVNLESLYPEVKKEIIDYLISASDNPKELKFVNPILTTIYYYYDVYLDDNAVDYINVWFKGDNHQQGDDLTPDKLIDSYSKLEYYNIQFDVSVIHGGVSPLLPYYGMEKMAERFPEYELNPFQDYDDINCCGKISIKNEINECFDILPENLSKILSNDVFQFLETIDNREAVVVDKGYVYMPHIFNKESIFEKPIIERHTDSESNLGKNIYPIDYKLFTMTKKLNITEKNYITYNDYVTICKEIYNLGYLSTNIIRKFSTVYLYIYENINSDKFYKCKLRFNVEDGKTVYQLIVPCECRNIVSRFIENK